MAQPAAVNVQADVAPASERQIEYQKKGFIRTFIERNPVGAIGFAILLFYILLAIFGPILVSADNPTDVQAIYAPPSAEHPLGTDFMGKDVLEQVIRGGRSIVVVGLLAALLTTFIGVVLGSLSAMIGGRFDTSMLVLADVVLTVPGIILLSVLAAYVRVDSPFLLAFIIAITAWPTLLRAVRAQVLSLKEREYVEAAKMLDLGTSHILFREIIPNMMSYILINFVFAMTAAIYAQIFLYFLGLVPLSGDNWGLMIQQAYTKGALFFKDSLLYILAPIVMISVLQLSLVMISRSLEDVFNPRLREG
ncbi:MAG: ABC transporter permease [Chloroflexota bacterium]|nr:ABC transporter permease [Chloroflexota bacterium]